jgi:hypothetical protein
VKSRAVRSMPQADPDFIRLFTDPLERQRIPYMITVATAAILYGSERGQALRSVIPLDPRSCELGIQISGPDPASASHQEKIALPPEDAVSREC